MEETLIDLSDIYVTTNYKSDYGDWQISSWNVLVKDDIWVNNLIIKELLDMGYRKVTLDELKDLIMVLKI